MDEGKIYNMVEEEGGGVAVEADRGFVAGEEGGVIVEEGGCRKRRRKDAS